MDILCLYYGHMPTAHIYIKEEDLRLWEAIENKSQWIHEQLAGAEEQVDTKLIKVLVREQVEEELNKRQAEYS